MRRAASVVIVLGVAACLAPAPARSASLFLQVDTAAITLAPAPADYVRDYVEATGAAGISLRIKTNDPVGMAVMIRCSDPAPQIRLNDFLVRTLSAPGAGGTSLATYTPIQATNMFLWSTGSQLAPFFVVSTDIRVRNLIGYDDAASAGTRAYSNTLVFTVVAQ